MPEVLFDKLAYKDRLTRAGIPDDQARAHAEALAEALGESVATKADMTLLRAELAAMESRLTIRMGVGAVGLFAALAALKFFG